jgi:hypothetical protein
MNITDKMLDEAQIVYDTFSVHCFCERNAISKAIQAAMSTAWVSVDEKLPNNFVQVLVLDSQEGYHVATYSEEPHQWFGTDNLHLYDVTHWMSFPEFN